jgi:hypothetical protein
LRRSSPPPDCREQCRAEPLSRRSGRAARERATVEAVVRIAA